MHLTPEELSARTRIALGTLANWRNQRRGPAFLKLGARVLYPLAEVEQWEKARTIPTRE